MLFCPIAAKAPSAIEAIEMTTRICCHCGGRAERLGETRSAGHRGDLGAAAKNAVTGVGAPS